MVRTKNANNQKCPANIIEAVQIAQNILQKAIKQLETGRDTSEYWGQFVDKNKGQMLQAMKGMQTQIQTTLRHGEVAPKEPEQEEESRGYRYEVRLEDDGVYAYTDGEGDGALITITSHTSGFSKRGLAWQWLHEISHATPSLQTMDYGYVNERIFPYLKSLGKSNNADSIVAAIFSVEGVDPPKEKRFDSESDIYDQGLSEQVKSRVKKIMAIAQKGVAQLADHELSSMQEIVNLKEKASAQLRHYQLEGEEKKRFETMATILTNKEAPTLIQIKEAVSTARQTYQLLHQLCFGEPQKFRKASGKKGTSWLTVEDLVDKCYVWGIHESVLTDLETTRAAELLAIMIEQDKKDLLLKDWKAETMAKLAIKFYEKW
jgi:hypothetical protein